MYAKGRENKLRRKGFVAELRLNFSNLLSEGAEVQKSLRRFLSDGG